MLLYKQRSGEIILDGHWEGVGYAGRGLGKNNPDMEDVAMTGPIPRGHWRIIQPPYTHPKLGPIVFNLEPVGHNAHGRSLFRLHGDSLAHPGEASDGCLVCGRTIRERIASDHETQLEVVI